jgi:hypothetical protein
MQLTKKKGGGMMKIKLLLFPKLEKDDKFERFKFIQPT